jgi:ryanodine receptor 2
MMNRYQPDPKDTSDITLPKEIVALAEKLAENAHDVWAKQRMSEGWTYGPERDDGEKKHPCLIPYRDLPESEKEYDRKASMETLKLILSEGYRIVAPE